MTYCHSSPYEGHMCISKSDAKILQVVLYWPTIFRDMHIFTIKCDRCQRTGKISQRDKIPQKPILEVEIFDVWGINFMGQFPSSNGNKYILVIMEYVSKWIKIISSPINGAQVVTKMLKNVIFPRFGTSRLVVSDGGSHFISKFF